MKLQDVVNEKVENFVKTRRGDGKKYIREIIKTLLNRRYDDPDGWVRAKEIRHIIDSKCSDQTLFRLLADLASEKIIERNPINDNEVYYRVPTNYQTIFFLSRTELIDKLKESYDGIVELSDKLKIAKEFLKEFRLLNPDEVIESELKARKISRKLLFEQTIKKGISDGSISIQPPIITPDDDVATNRFL